MMGAWTDPINADFPPSRALSGAPEPPLAACQPGRPSLGSAGSPERPPTRSTVKLSELLPSAAIRLDVDGHDKWELIGVLTDALIASGQVGQEQREAVHEALVQREKSMSTGMEKGIAIPHASVEVVQETAVALGVARQGIDFEAMDGQSTHLVILLVNPANQTRDHIRNLAEIARLLSSSSLREALQGVASPEEALECIQAAEASVG